MAEREAVRMTSPHAHSQIVDGDGIRRSGIVNPSKGICGPVAPSCLERVFESSSLVDVMICGEEDMLGLGSRGDRRPV